MLKRRWNFLAQAMDDKLHQPHRASLIPGLFEVISEAKMAGAFGAALSGAGPCIVALASDDKAEAVGKVMKKVFESHSFESKKISAGIVSSEIDSVGTKVDVIL
jgi:homoserine kinase